MILLILACAGEPVESVYTLASPTIPPRADPAIPVPVSLSLAVAAGSFSGRDTWPTVDLSATSGTWVGDTDALLEDVPLAEPTYTAWLLPDRTTATVVIDSALSYAGATWRVSHTIALCPAALSTLVLNSSGAGVLGDEPVTITATVATASGGVPSPGTVVSVTLGGAAAVLERAEAPIDENGQATFAVYVSAVGTLSVSASAAEPQWTGCTLAEPLTADLQVPVREADAVAAASVGDTGGDDSGTSE